jgi:hypothetical protein
MRYSLNTMALRWIAPALALGLMLSGCGGGDTATSSPITAPANVVAPASEAVAALSLIARTPSSGMTSVARDVAPQLTFSANLNSVTATGSNVSLTSVSGSVTVSLAVTGNRLTVTPARRLSLLTNYTLQVGTGLTGAGGETLATAQTMSFKTADGTWGTAQAIPTGGGAAYEPQVALDASGNAMAVWYEYDGTTYNIFSARYTPATGWGAAQLIETGGGFAFLPEIAIGPGGNAIAVWYQQNGSNYDIHANSYTVAAGWGTAQLIESGSSYAYVPRMAMDASGNAIVVWYQHDGAVFNIHANRYSVATGWGVAEQIEIASENAYGPQLAMDAAGNGIAVWFQSDGPGYSIHANRYTLGAGWGAAQLIETGGGDAHSARISMDTNGNAIATWSQSDGANYRIYANRYSATTGWGTEQAIDIGGRDAWESEVAFDGAGNAIAVWRNYDGTVHDLYTSRYVPGTGWTTAQLLEVGTGNAYAPHIKFDASGNAIAIWRQDDGTAASINVARYVAGTGWGTPQLIENEAASAIHSQIAIDGSGNAFVVWGDAVGQLHVNRFD